MSLPRQDFDMTAQTQKILYFTLADGGTPLDLTGANITWQLSQQPDGEPLLTKGNTIPQTGITVSNPTAGELFITIENDDIAAAGLYWHLLFVTIAGARTPVAAGRAVVMPSPVAAS